MLRILVSILAFLAGVLFAFSPEAVYRRVDVPLPTSEPPVFDSLDEAIRSSSYVALFRTGGDSVEQRTSDCLFVAQYNDDLGVVVRSCDPSAVNRIIFTMISGNGGSK